MIRMKCSRVMPQAIEFARAAFKSQRVRCGIIGMLLSVTSGFSAGTVYIQGRVVTIDGFPGSDLVVSFKTAAVRDTTDTAGAFSLPLPVTALRQENRYIPAQGRRGGQLTPILCMGNERLTEQNNRFFDVAGRAIDFNRSRSPFAGNGVYIKQSVHTSVFPAALLSKSAVPFGDTLVIAYCDSIQIKAPVSLADTGKALVITLVNDLAPKGHRFLAASYSNNAAYVISTANTIEATYKMPGPVQDAWRLSNNHILLSGGDSVREVDAGGKVTWGFKSSCGGEMHNCQPLRGGKRFFGENCSGKLFIADSAGTAAAVPNILMKDLGSNNNHSRFRMARNYDSLFLITAMGEGVVYMINTRGDTLRKISDAKLSRFGVTFNAVHSAILLPGGNILIGTGYTGFFIEVDKKDSVVWKVSATDLPGLGLAYAAGCQRLRNGNTLCAAYSSTTKFFEITHQKHVVWKSNAGGAVGNPTHIFLLDVNGDPAKGELLR